MKRFFLFIAVAIITVSGCSTFGNGKTIKLGMSKQDVLSAFGPPVTLTTRAGDPAEYLHYKPETLGHEEQVGESAYSIAILNGRVQAYGQPHELGITDVGF